jgi:hypothetical protein
VIGYHKPGIGIRLPVIVDFVYPEDEEEDSGKGRPEKFEWCAKGLGGSECPPDRTEANEHRASNDTVDEAKDDFEEAEDAEERKLRERPGKSVFRGLAKAAKLVESYRDEGLLARVVFCRNWRVRRFGESHSRLNVHLIQKVSSILRTRIE